MAKKHKYGAIKVKEDGYTFDSKAEFYRYRELLLLQRAGEIQSLRVHPKYECVVNGILVAKVILDFEYFDVKSKMKVVEDVKGKDTTVSRLKRKLIKAVHDIDVNIVKN